MTFIPAAATWSSIEARAPLPTATIVRTAPTPIVMPSRVSAERRPLRRSVSQARPKQADRSIVSGRDQWHACQFPAGVTPGFVLRIGEDVTVLEADHSGAVFGDLVVVGDQDDGDPALHPKTLEDFHHLNARARVEVARWFVGQEDRGLRHERTCDRDTLLLSAGQLVLEMV